MGRSWVLSIPLLGGCVQKLYAELEQVPSVRLCGSMDAFPGMSNLPLCLCYRAKLHGHVQGFCECFSI